MKDNKKKIIFFIIVCLVSNYIDGYTSIYNKEIKFLFYE